MKSNWIRLSGIYGLIFIFFGAVAAVFFHQTFLAPAAYVEIAIGLIAVFIYMLNFFGDTTKTLWKKRDVLFGGLGAGLVLILLIGVNVVANSKLGEQKFDLTVNKIHSLSDESKELLHNLPQDIEVISFVTNVRSKKLLSNLVEKYIFISDKVKFKAVDPDQEPTALEAYDAQVNQVVVRNTETGKSISIDESQFNEEGFTTALRRVLVEGSKTVYFLQGSGEGEIADDKTEKGLFLAKFFLEREGYQVKALDLLKEGKIPEDALVVVAWGAERPVSETQVRVLEDFLTKGGKVVLGQDPILSPRKDRILPNGYEPLLKKHGLEFGGSILVQNLNFQNRNIRSGTVLGLTYTEHPIVTPLQGNLTQFPLAQSIEVQAQKKEAGNQQVLVLSSEDVAAVSNLSTLSGDQRLASSGPYALARIVSEKTNEAEESAELDANQGPEGFQLIVFGDSDFASNQNIQSGFNRDLFLNTFAYLLGQGENVSIRAKNWRNSTLEITEEQKRAVYFASIFVIPQIIILLGLGIWAVRRNRV